MLKCVVCRAKIIYNDCVKVWEEFEKMGIKNLFNFGGTRDIGIDLGTANVLINVSFMLTLALLKHSYHIKIKF